MAPRRPKTSDDDPLTRAIAPPPNETPAQRELRIAAEQEAKRVSDAIDDELNRQRIADKKNPKPVKILLLGAFPTRLTPPALQSSPPLLFQVRANLVCWHLIAWLFPTEQLSVGKSTTLKSR